MKIFKLFIKFVIVLSLFFFLSNSRAAVNPTETAIFAGGCFWCMQADFDKVPGVVKTTVGYTGGRVKNPTYDQVSRGGTGHYETVKIIYNPNQISYEKLLSIFWRNIDPLDFNGQFCDKGQQYQAAIFYNNEQQKQLAEASKNQLLQSGQFKKIAAKILPANTFYSAEEYHQKYYQKNPIRYKYYRYSCGRDKRLKQIWESKLK